MRNLLFNFNLCLVITNTSVIVNQLFSTVYYKRIISLDVQYSVFSYDLYISGRRGSFMLGEVVGWTAPTHPVFVREQRQRPTTSSMWFAVTSVAVRGTDWSAGQHQSTGLQWTRSTDTAWHAWTGQWRLQSSSFPVWIHSWQVQQEQRLYLFNCRSAKTQTCLSVDGKCGWNCFQARRVNGTWQRFSAGNGRCVSWRQFTFRRVTNPKDCWLVLRLGFRIRVKDSDRIRVSNDTDAIRYYAVF